MDDGVSEEGEAFSLEVLVFAALAAEGVEGFAFAELAVDKSAVLLVV
ncbi:MAG: hypothetical protein OXS29_02965 [bacterium]|nr:hypothetical protein [bacterium]MDE0288492.1 hypothetical protein [bacterium]MDE0439243.1 hypothetical protein [bacterium]